MVRAIAAMRGSSKPLGLVAPGKRSSLAVAALCVALWAASLLAACSKETPEGLIAAAQRHIAARDDRSAQIELRNAIRLAPKSGTAFRLLGETLLRTDDPVTAESALRKALSLSERPEDVQPTLALALIRQGQPQRLIDEFGSVKLQEPAADASLQASLGQAWLMRGNVKQAGDAFAAALTAVPNHPRARLGQAQITAHEGRVDEALAMTDQALKADPRLVEAHAFRGQLLMAKGQRAAATESLEKAIATDASYLPARVALASMLISEREYDKAQALLGAASASSAKDPRLAYLRGLLALRKGELQKAKDEFAAILKQAPEHIPTLIFAGEVELRLGNLNLAEQLLGKAARSRVAGSAAQRLLAATYLRQGRPGKAVDILQPLLQEPGPKDANLMMLAGEAFLANGDARRAAEFFEASKSEAATEAAARMRLGQIAVSRGDFDRGADELLAASAMSPQKVEPDLLLVALHLRRHEPEKALAAAESFVKKQPQNPLGYVLAGTAHAARKDRNRARQSFDAALKIKPDYLPAVRGLAGLDLAEGRPADAKRRYEALIAKKPDDEQLLIALAQLQERTGNVAEAGTTLRRAIKANPQSQASYVALVQYHLRRKDPKAALAVAQEAVASNPAQLQLVELLALTQEAAGAGDDAVRTLTALVLKEPHALGPLLKLAAIQAGHRDFDAATKTLLRAQKEAPEHEGVARELVAVYLANAKIDQALGVAKSLQVRRPNEAIGYALEGDVRAFNKKWPEAERAYRTALNAEPKSSAVAVRLYRMLVVAGRRVESAAFARDWIARNPADVPMRMFVADAALSARDYKTAALHYETVLRHDPNNVLALNNLAWTLGELNDPKAIGVAERAVELAPNSPPVLDTLGMLYLRGGDPKKGFEVLERVHKLDPHRKDLRMHYAMGLIQVGRTEEGKAELRELASSKEDFPGKADIPGLLGRP